MRLSLWSERVEIDSVSLVLTDLCQRYTNTCSSENNPMSLDGDEGNGLLIIAHVLHEPVRCDRCLGKNWRRVQLDLSGVVPSGTYLENRKWSNLLLASVRSNDHVFLDFRLMCDERNISRPSLTSQRIITDDERPDGVESGFYWYSEIVLLSRNTITWNLSFTNHDSTHGEIRHSFPEPFVSGALPVKSVHSTLMTIYYAWRACAVTAVLF